jgi:hypothetical protein
VPLSREYRYQEFDPPPAYFTGVISDEGVDADGDGKFDYLKVGVEVDVTEYGLYQVGISGLLANGYYVSVYDYDVSPLNVGTRYVYLKLHGPTIYLSNLNITAVDDLYLYKVDYFYTTWLGSISNVPLSRQYYYYEFDPPFADIEAKFTVYPNGQVVMGGTLNYSRLPYPYTNGIDVSGDLSFKDTAGSTEMSANIAFIVQEYMADVFPYQGTSFQLTGTYNGEMANIGITASVNFPENLASQFPLNLSDFTVMAYYADNDMVGTITAPLISGMPIATIDVDFHGNITDLYLSDELEITYGTYFGYEVNETVVENMLLQLNTTIPGRGSGSLYEATRGILECVWLNTTMIKRTGGATISFDAYIHGDFLRYFVLAISGGYYENPGLYWFLNAFVYSIETGQFELSYAKTFRTASMDLEFTANVTKLLSTLESTIPPDVPPSQRAPIELFLNTTFCAVESAQVYWTYANSRSDMQINATIGGDFNAELNFIKNLYITYNNPYPPEIWQFINSTELDLSNLHAAFNLTRTSALGSIENFVVKPPTDPADSDYNQFKLTRFFNLTYSPYGEPPTKDTRLKLTVEGGYNSTHTVTIINPITRRAPPPDMASPDGTRLIWLNQSVSSLRDLIFDIKYQGVFEWYKEIYRVVFDTNSTIENFDFNRDQKQFSFNVVGETGTIGFCNISIPKALLYAAPESWVIIVGESHPLQYLTEYNVTETDTHTFIYFTFTHSAHTIIIRGIEVVQEFDAVMLLSSLLIATLTIVLIYRTKNKRKTNSNFFIHKL